MWAITQRNKTMTGNKRTAESAFGTAPNKLRKLAVACAEDTDRVAMEVLSNRSPPDLILRCKEASYLVHTAILCLHSDLLSDIVIHTTLERSETHPLVNQGAPIRVVDFSDLITDRAAMRACLDLMYDAPVAPGQIKCTHALLGTWKVAEALQCHGIVKRLRAHIRGWVEALARRIPKALFTPHGSTITEEYVAVVGDLSVMVDLVREIKEVNDDLVATPQFQQMWSRALDMHTSMCKAWKSAGINPLYDKLDEILCANRTLRDFLIYGFVPKHA